MTWIPIVGKVRHERTEQIRRMKMEMEKMMSYLAGYHANTTERNAMSCGHEQYDFECADCRYIMDYNRPYDWFAGNPAPGLSYYSHLSPNEASVQAVEILNKLNK